MARGSAQKNNSFLMLLSLAAVFMLSLYFIDQKGIFNLGSRAAKSKATVVGTLLMPDETECVNGNYAVLSTSGECTSIVSEDVDDYLRSEVRVQGVLREGVIYATSIKQLGSEGNDNGNNRPSDRPIVLPSSPGKPVEPTPLVPPPLD